MYLVEQVDELFLLCDVTGHVHHPVLPELLPQLLQGGLAAVLLHVGDAHLGASAQQPHREGFPQALGGPSDQAHFVLYVHFRGFRNLQQFNNGKALSNYMVCMSPIVVYKPGPTNQNKL